MRKREIHSAAHWAMMFILLMFPILMVGISVFDKNDYTEHYEVVDITSFDELKVGNTYTFSSSNSETVNSSGKVLGVSNVNIIVPSSNETFNDTLLQADSFTTTYYSNVAYLVPKINGVSQDGLAMNVRSIVFSFTLTGEGHQNTNTYAECWNSFLSKRVYTSNNYKTDVNFWIDEFLDLPINSWYKSLMNVIGVGFTNSSVMNVIYVMPVYILWVFIFDVIVDCFLVIIKLPHKLLNRLSGGENE